jgi:small subunit ribosomal protein S6
LSSYVYEGMFLAHNKEARKDVEYLEEHVRQLLEKSGGTVAHLKKWDERKLAYPIKGVTHGIYLLAFFTGEKDVVSKLRAEVRLSSLVLRQLVLRREVMPEAIETFAEYQSRMAALEKRDEAASALAPRGEDGLIPAVADIDSLIEEDT